VNRRYELHASLCDSPGGEGFLRRAYLIDDDDFGHVIFYGFYHDSVLKIRLRHLHTSRTPYAGMRHIAVSGYLVRCVDDDDSLFQIIGQHSRCFAQEGRLSHSGFSHQQRAFARFYYISDYIYGSIDRPTHATGQPNDFAQTISNGRYSMKRALYACAVVASEMSQST
jgi:hypothetical protein